MKYALERMVPGHIGDDSTAGQITEWHFPTRIPPMEKKSKLGNEERLFSTARTVMLHCVSGSV